LKCQSRCKEKAFIIPGGREVITSITTVKAKELGGPPQKRAWSRTETSAAGSVGRTTFIESLSDHLLDKCVGHIVEEVSTAADDLEKDVLNYWTSKLPTKRRGHATRFWTGWTLKHAAYLRVMHFHWKKCRTLEGTVLSLDKQF
jgi:hypothetical protein